MDWLKQIEEWHAWLALALLLGGAELVSLDLVLLMMAVGAVVGMVVALTSLGLPFQILAAVGASVGMLALVRPGIVKRLHAGPELTLGHSALIGKQGLVLDEVSGQGGRIKIAGEIWTARSYDETETIAAGATVDVFEIKGATALVHKVPTLEP